MSFTRYDFEETLAIVSIAQSQIKRVLAAWGDSTEGWGEWSGGFLLKLKDGADKQYAYITGWCDTTGWGCQDGADVTYYSEEPTTDILEKVTEDFTYGDDQIRWELEPTDLNRFIRGEIDVNEYDIINDDKLS